MVNAQNAQSEAAFERAKKSPVIVVRVSARRYGIARITGAAAYGIGGESTMIGIQSATMLKGLNNLTWSEVLGYMYSFDTGQDDPHEWDTL